MQLSPFKQAVRDHFERFAAERRRWKAKGRHYHEQQAAYFRFLVPPGKRVLELGCGAGELLAALEPAEGVGVDFSPAMLAEARAAFPHLIFASGDAEDPASWQDEQGRGVKGPFDVVILSDALSHFEDVQACLENLRPLCTAETRLIIGYYNFLWEPVLKLSERLGLKMPQRLANWLSPGDIENLLALADFEAVKADNRMLLPVRIPLLQPTLDFLAGLPLVRHLCGSKVISRCLADGRACYGDFGPFGDFGLLFGAPKPNLKILDLPIRLSGSHLRRNPDQPIPARLAPAQDVRVRHAEAEGCVGSGQRPAWHLWKRLLCPCAVEFC